MRSQKTIMELLSNSNQLFGRPIKVGDVVAAVTLFGGGPTWAKCIESLVLHTDPTIPLVIFEDHGPSEVALVEAKEICSKHGKVVWLYKQPQNLGVVGNLNTAFNFLNPADVIVLNSDIIVGPGWSTRLVSAARSRTDIATATALSSNATIFTVSPPKAWGDETPSIEDFASVSRIVAENSKQVRPTVPVATSFCTLFTRKALNVVGGLDMIFSPGYGEEVDFSLRCVSMGFTNVAADDVYVFHATGESFGDTEVNPRKVANDLLVSKMYPFWDGWIHAFQLDALNALNVVRTRTAALINGLTVVIDAELIDPNYTGTYEGALALTRALAENSKVKSVSWVAEQARVTDLKRLAKSTFGTRIEVVSLASLPTLPKFDVALRPSQDYGSRSWPVVRLNAHRNVVWHLDTISTNNPFYHANLKDFESTAWSVRASWQSADAIAVLTDHVAESVLAAFDINVSSQKISVIPNGSPNPQTGLPASAENLETIASLEGEQFLLVLGTSFFHKNRAWFLKLFAQVLQRGFKGKLVFAGPNPTTGSSVKLERELLEANPNLAAQFLSLGRVGDDERNWLLANAMLVVSPTINEGFGMTPFEAAIMGTPVLATKGGGLRDVAPSSAFSLSLQNDNEDVELIMTLISDPVAREAQLSHWLKTMENFSWESSAESFVKLFYELLSRPGEVALNWKLESTSRIKRSMSSRVISFSVAIALKMLGTGTRRRNFASKVYNWMR
jgi:glycosyltransferase involved in cell wall biosynthesis/GT2 family glycosyltransferase